MPRWTESLEERFWKKVDMAPGHGPHGDCWMWIKKVDRKGYGLVFANGKVSLAHRISYLITHGVIPDGLMIMHSCDIRGCVNPSHLSAGTCKDNLGDMATKGRGANQKKTHCKRGHEYTPENTKKSKTKRGAAARICRVCLSAQSRESYQGNLMSINQLKGLYKHPAITEADRHVLLRPMSGHRLSNTIMFATGIIAERGGYNYSEAKIKAMIDAGLAAGRVLMSNLLADNAKSERFPERWLSYEEFLIFNARIVPWRDKDSPDPRSPLTCEKLLDYLGRIQAEVQRRREDRQLNPSKS